MLSDSLVIPDESVHIWTNEYLLHNYNCINLTNLNDLSTDLLDNLNSDPDKCRQMIEYLVRL